MDCDLQFEKGCYRETKNLKQENEFEWDVLGWLVVGVRKENEGNHLVGYSNWPDNEDQDYSYRKEEKRIRKKLGLETSLE